MKSTLFTFGLSFIGLAANVDYARDVQPLLERRCYVCHGAAQQMSGLRLDRKSDALRGGYSGAVILPGNSANSRLVRLISGVEEGLVMPPAGPRLTADEIESIRNWIDGGAAWSGTEADAQPTQRPKSDHWSFRPLHRPRTPRVNNAGWVRNPIDAFVLARLEKESIEPSPEAGRETLIRRASLDLTGLPPTPERVARFVHDPRPDAYERLIDELLASDHYGEKWASHWLDLARYADSDGYEKDMPRPHAWRWRNWVIDALNRDMPFDQFTIEQVAGDLLPNASVEQKVATGFHRNTLTNREGGIKLAQFRFEETVDRANTVGAVWLGLTVGCAQCHDHKFDPISQKDYYRFYAFFNSIEQQHIDAPVSGELGPYLRVRDEYLAKREQLLKQYNTLKVQTRWEKKLRKAVEQPGKWTDYDLNWDTLQKMSNGGDRILFIPPRQRTFRQQEILTDYFLRWYNQVVPGKEYKKLGFKELLAKLADLTESYPQLSQARVVFENPRPEQAHLYVRGQWDRPGIPVEPETPEVLPPLAADGQPNRLDLARWLVSPDNPLTARVAVNRIWQEYFGRGLALTSDDFGTQGDRPSHPRLLDWLAAEFVDRAWSLKVIHRLIVTSAVYRQSSNARPELGERDPNNILLARQVRLRLPAELVRDNALAVGGLLYTRIGGPSVRPPMPKGVAELGYANSVKWKESPGRDAYRRGIYVHLQRTVPYPFLMNFDSTDHTVTKCRRGRSNTPLQALNLLNDPVFFEASLALATRIVTEVPNKDFQSRLDYAFRLCLSRPPQREEHQRLAIFYEQRKQALASKRKVVSALAPARIDGAEPYEMAAWVGVSRVLLNLDEFITRE